MNVETVLAVANQLNEFAKMQSWVGVDGASSRYKDTNCLRIVGGLDVYYYLLNAGKKVSDQLE